MSATVFRASTLADVTDACDRAEALYRGIDDTSGLHPNEAAAVRDLAQRAYVALFQARILIETRGRP